MLIEAGSRFKQEMCVCVCVCVRLGQRYVPVGIYEHTDMQYTALCVLYGCTKCRDVQ